VANHIWGNYSPPLASKALKWSKKMGDRVISSQDIGASYKEKKELQQSIEPSESEYKISSKVPLTRPVRQIN
jgi:hypothetical protein